jgi:hypothetical protein
MNKTFPEGRKLGEPVRLRIFEADKAIVAQAALKTGIQEEEIKRRAIHVGLGKLAELLGIDLAEKKKAA